MRRRVYEVIVLTADNCLHELFGETNAYVEIGNLRAVGLALNKRNYIGVVYAQYAHISAAPRASLFNRLSRGVEYLHKAYGTRCNASRRKHRRTQGTKP